MLPESLLSILVTLIVTITVLAIAYIKWNNGYWKRRNVPYLENQSILKVFNLKETAGLMVKRSYDEMRQKKWKIGGMYQFLSPTCMVTDLDLVKTVMTKDFHNFVDRGVFTNEKDDPLSGHLFSIGGQKWRNLRVKLSPTFTSGKMKMMFQTLVDCEDQLLAKVESDCVNKNPIDIKEVLACFTTDIIGSCAFGLELQSFSQDDSLFRRYGQKIFTPTASENLLRLFLHTFPELGRKLHLKIIPQDISEFFMSTVQKTVGYREKNNYKRKDFLQLLIDLKNEATDDNGKPIGQTLTIEELAAQCFVFFLAGFETSSTTMTFALYEMSKNQQIQDKVREEIVEVLAKHNNKVIYEAIQDMKYMNQVIDETLRKYPPVPFVTRESASNYKVPGTDFVVEKGIRVMIPIMGIHHDEEYYPNPNKFDPDRFTEEKKQTRHSYAHIPFGEGPRICNGMRFGVMQSKVGLTALLRKYKFSINKKTQEPLTIKPKSFILAAEGEVWLNAQKL